jgi:hypothetical protein
VTGVQTCALPIYKRQFISALPILTNVIILLFAPRKYAQRANSALAMIATAFLKNYVRRAFEDGMTKETFVKGLLDTPFSLDFSHSDYPPVILLNTLKYLYLAYEINRLIFDIENECTKLNIKSKIMQQLVSPNNNYFILPTEKALLAMAINEGFQCEKTWLVTKLIEYYLSLKRYMIPHATITQLSPDLQNRCYQLSHRVSALSATSSIMNAKKSRQFADKMNAVKNLLNHRIFILKESVIILKANFSTKMLLLKTDMEMLIEDMMIKNLREDGDINQAAARENLLNRLMQEHRDLHAKIPSKKISTNDVAVLATMNKSWINDKTKIIGSEVL